MYPHRSTTIPPTRETCSTKCPEYNRCEDLVRPDLPFGGYKDSSPGTATSALQNFRGKHPRIRDYSKVYPQEEGDAMYRPHCKDPKKESRHYNVYVSGIRPKKSAGSIARCICCIDGKPPKLIMRYGILNIKDNNIPPTRYYSLG